jgi:hypothetical protein
MSSLITSNHGLSSRGLVTRYTSILHESAASTQACHDRIRLPCGLSICIESSGRAHSVVLSITFFDKTANRVGPVRWAEVWSETIASKKQAADVYGGGDEVDAMTIGLLIDIANMGRKSFAACAIYWDADAPPACRHGCKTWKVGESAGRPKVTEVPTAGGHRTINTPYGVLRCDRQSTARSHSIGGFPSSNALQYLDD